MDWTQKEGKSFSIQSASVDIDMTLSIGLTFAGLYALKPPVIYIFVCTTSAVLVPSTARSATTYPTGFCKPAALRANDPTKDR